MKTYWRENGLTKATKILNKYEIQNMLLHSEKIDFSKFYNSELIQILEVAHMIIKNQYKRIKGEKNHET